MGNEESMPQKHSGTSPSRSRRSAEYPPQNPSRPHYPSTAAPAYGADLPPAYNDIYGGSPSSSSGQHHTPQATLSPGSDPYSVRDSRGSTGSSYYSPSPSAPAATFNYPSPQQPSTPSYQLPHAPVAQNWQQQEEENELRMWFAAVDESNDGRISVDELRQALVNDNFTPFNVETVKWMLKLFDKDMSSTIEFTEFAGLKRYIQEWKKTFDQFDRDKSGTIDSEEVHQALYRMGFVFSPGFSSELCSRFGQRGSSRMDLDGFIYACAMINAIAKDYQRLNRNMSLEDYVRRWIRT